MAIRESFLREIWGDGLCWCSRREQFATVFSPKIIIFHQFTEFSSSRVSRYTVCLDVFSTFFIIQCSSCFIGHESSSISRNLISFILPLSPSLSQLESNPTLKYVSLIVLTFQNAILIVSMRYTRVLSGDMYFTTTAVVLSEFSKMVICLIIIFFQQDSIASYLSHLYEAIIVNWKDTLKMSVPAIVYMLQNNLQYVAVSNLEAAVFQVRGVLVWVGGCGRGGKSVSVSERGVSMGGRGASVIAHRVVTLSFWCKPCFWATPN